MFEESLEEQDVDVKASEHLAVEVKDLAEDDVLDKLARNTDEEIV